MMSMLIEVCVFVLIQLIQLIHELVVIVNL